MRTIVGVKVAIFLHFWNSIYRTVTLFICQFIYKENCQSCIEGECETRVPAALFNFQNQLFSNQTFSSQVCLLSHFQILVWLSFSILFSTVLIFPF